MQITWAYNCVRGVNSSASDYCATPTNHWQITPVRLRNTGAWQYRRKTCIQNANIIVCYQYLEAKGRESPPWEPCLSAAVPKTTTLLFEAVTTTSSWTTTSGSEYSASANIHNLRLIRPPRVLTIGSSVVSQNRLNFEFYIQVSTSSSTSRGLVKNRKHSLTFHATGRRLGSVDCMLTCQIRFTYSDRHGNLFPAFERRDSGVIYFDHVWSLAKSLHLLVVCSNWHLVFHQRKRQESAHLAHTSISITTESNGSAM